MKNEEEFQVDPLLPYLFEGKQDDSFCLGLIVNWPPPLVMQKDYESFVSKVQQLFQQDEDSFYFLPFQTLHITVATLYPATRLDAMENVSIDQIKKDWKDILLRTSKLPEWPKDPLHFSVESSQIGARAGILLWKEHTGGLDRIRSCLARAVEDSGVTMKTHLEEYMRIPDIIHSTFVRYAKQPTSSPQMLQEQLKTHVPIHEVFTRPIEVDCIQIVNCKIYLQTEHPVALCLHLGHSKS
jgi:hypothetical protein